MDKLLYNLYHFNKYFSDKVDTCEILIKAKNENDEICDYTYIAQMNTLKEFLYQTLGQCENEKKCKILSVAVRPIYDYWLLKEF